MGNDRSPESNVPRSNVVFSKGSDQKQPRKGGDIIFPIISQLGLLVAMETNLPQNLTQAFPNPNDATHNIWSRLANWLQRYSSSKVWNFHHSKASNAKMSGLIRPKIEPNQAFMPVLVTSNFDDGSKFLKCNTQYMPDVLITNTSDEIHNFYSSANLCTKHYKDILRNLEPEWKLIKPRYDTTNNQQLPCLTGVFTRTWRRFVSSATHKAHSKDSYQTGWMPRLIWVFLGVQVILLLCRHLAV